MGPAFELAPGVAEQAHPTVAWRAGHWEVVWQVGLDAPSELWFARISPAGQVVDGPTPIPGVGGNATALHAFDDRSILSWVDDHADPPRVVVVPLDLTADCAE